MSKKLTPKQLEVLKRASHIPVWQGSTDFPTSTLKVLVERGLMVFNRGGINKGEGTHLLTEDGCAEIGVRMVDVQMRYIRNHFEGLSLTYQRTPVRRIAPDGSTVYELQRDVDYDWQEFKMMRALDAAIELTRAELRAMKGE